MKFTVETILLAICVILLSILVFFPKPVYDDESKVEEFRSRRTNISKTMWVIKQNLNKANYAKTLPDMKDAMRNIKKHFDKLKNVEVELTDSMGKIDNALISVNYAKSIDDLTNNMVIIKNEFDKLNQLGR